MLTDSCLPRSLSARSFVRNGVRISSNFPFFTLLFLVKRNTVKPICVNKIKFGTRRICIGICIKWLC